MYRCYLFLLFYCLATFGLGAQSPLKMVEEILSSPPDTHQIRALTQLSDSLRNASILIPDTLFESGLRLAAELDDLLGLAKLHQSRYRYCFNYHRTEEGLADVLKTIEYAREINDPEILKDALLSEVNFYWLMGDVEQGASRGTALIRQFHKENDLIGASKANSIMGKLSELLKDVKRTEYYDSTALALAYQSGDAAAISSAASLIAINLIRNGGSVVRASELATEAVRTAELSGNAALITMARNNRSAVYTAQRKFAEALEDFDWLEKNNNGQRVPLLINKAILLGRMGRYEEEVEVLHKAVAQAKVKKVGHINFVAIYTLLQMKGLSADQRDSVRYYGKLMALHRDSIQIEKNTQSLLELEEKYKAADRETEIQLQKSELKRQRSLLYFTLAAALLFLIMGIGFFLLSNRLKRKNEENEKLVDEKETLIGEIHHRVKNNLQVISSLLQLQRRGLSDDDEKGRGALLESQSRVSAMGLIHTKLYQGEEVTSVNMPDYLTDLGGNLLGAYQLEERVEIFYDVEDFSLDVDKAIPLGLIINELVTNALKYAFPNGREGTIEIALHHEDGQLRLIVNDDGVGQAAAEKRADSTAFGTNLIALLTKKLKGSLRLTEGKGYGVEIRFAE